MSRYIDAEYVKAVMINDRLMQGNAEFTLYAQEVERQVNALPSIEVVRCKECKWWHKLHGCIKNDDVNLCTNDDDFCSYGERREP